MAEIHVQTKKSGSPVWLWVLLALLILGTIAYILIWRNNNKTDQKNTTNQSSQTSLIQYNGSGEA